MFTCWRCWRWSLNTNIIKSLKLKITSTWSLIIFGFQHLDRTQKIQFQTTLSWYGKSTEHIRGSCLYLIHYAWWWWPRLLTVSIPFSFSIFPLPFHFNFPDDSKAMDKNVNYALELTQVDQSRCNSFENSYLKEFLEKSVGVSWWFVKSAGFALISVSQRRSSRSQSRSRSRSLSRSLSHSRSRWLLMIGPFSLLLLIDLGRLIATGWSTSFWNSNT